MRGVCLLGHRKSFLMPPLPVSRYSHRFRGGVLSRTPEARERSTRGGAASSTGVSEERRGRADPRLGQAQGWLGLPPPSNRTHRLGDELRGQRPWLRGHRNRPLREPCPLTEHTLCFWVPPFSRAQPGCWAVPLWAPALYNGRTRNSQLNHAALAELRCPLRAVPLPWFTNRNTWSSRTVKSA